MAGRRTQLSDVARLAQVAKSTAAAALRPGAGGRNARVGAATAERVRKAAAQLGYRPDPLAGALRGAPSQSIACLWHFVDPWCLDGPVGSELLWRLQQDGLVTYQAEHPRQLDRVLAVLEDLLSRRPDALVIRPSGWLLDAPEIPPLLRRFPAVLAVVPWHVPAWGIDQLVHDRDAPIRELARHFARSGRRHPAIIVNLADVTDQRKLRVFREACSQEGIAAPVTVADISRFRREYAERREAYTHTVGTLLGQAEPVDAIFCVNDLGVMVVARRLAENGHVPGQTIALAGLNDPPALGLWDPPLASIDRNQSRLVDTALDMLRYRMAHPQSPTDTRTVSMRFIWRASAGGTPSPGNTPCTACSPSA